MRVVRERSLCGNNLIIGVHTYIEILSCETSISLHWERNSLHICEVFLLLTNYATHVSKKKMVVIAYKKTLYTIHLVNPSCPTTTVPIEEERESDEGGRETKGSWELQSYIKSDSQNIIILFACLSVHPQVLITSLPEDQNRSYILDGWWHVVPQTQYNSTCLWCLIDDDLSKPSEYVAWEWIVGAAPHNNQSLREHECHTLKETPPQTNDLDKAKYICIIWVSSRSWSVKCYIWSKKFEAALNYAKPLAV